MQILLNIFCPISGKFYLRYLCTFVIFSTERATKAQTLSQTGKATMHALFGPTWNVMTWSCVPHNKINAFQITFFQVSWQSVTEKVDVQSYETKIRASETKKCY